MKKNAKRRSGWLLLVAAITTVLSGCATPPNGGQANPMAAIQNSFTYVETGIHNVFDNPDPCSNNDRNIGIAGGALAGALAAHFLGKRNGALIAGAAIGALAGGLIGHSMDSRRCTLYKIAEKNKLKLASAVITEQRLGVTPANGTSANHAVGLDVQLVNKQDEFLPGTATLTPQARVYLGEIANEYTPEALEKSLGPNASAAQRQQMANRQILIVGHTDERDDVPGVDLAKLSQERAKTVAQVFEQHGVPARNIYYQGAGDSLPLSSNATPSGRSDNNRVQIVDTPDLHTMVAFLQTREANPADFVSTKPTQAPTTALSTAASKSGSSATPTANVQTSTSGTAERANAPAHAISFLGRLEHKVQSLTLGSKLPPLAARSPSPSHAVAPAAAKVQTRQRTTVLGLVGQPMDAGYRIDLGAPTTHSLFSIFPSARAAAPVIVGPCWQDHPHNTTMVRNLASGEPLSIRNAIPGLYGEPWWGQQNDAAVAMLHVYAPRDGGAPVPPTTVEFYSKRPGSATWQLIAKDLHAPVNVYRGSRFTLYRVFLHKQVQCVDLAVPNPTASSRGYVIYQDGGHEYGASLQFTPRG